MMDRSEPKLCVVNVVGLTPAMIGAHTPNLKRAAGTLGAKPLQGVFPAVTTTAQATLLTGLPPSKHGVVGNGWLHRDTGEVRFWLQSNRLIQGEPLYDKARRLAHAQGKSFTCAKLFWWFNQGAQVEWSVTPKPHYGADGSKVFGVHGSPDDLAPGLEKKLGPFPFHTFWGPMAGLPCTDWIARCAAEVLTAKAPSLTFVYLPHLDYDLQRFGPTPEVVAARAAEVDRAFGVVLEAADKIGVVTAVVSEYGLVKADRPVYLNRVLREAGWLSVRQGPFGEMLDVFTSTAVAVVDHQAAHVYVNDPKMRDQVAERLAATPGVAEVLDEAGKKRLQIDHPRSGDLVALAEPDAWFAYPYWLDDRWAPDFARTVDIHRKPGYDPCELFVDPEIGFPKLRLARRLAAKKLGFRYLMDVVPLDARLVKGSHGLPAADPMEGPVFLSNSEAPPPVGQVDVSDWCLSALGLSTGGGGSDAGGSAASG